MRPAAACALTLLPLLLAGCFGSPFKPTPCKPAGTPSEGTLAVHLAWYEGSERVAYHGCVALQEQDGGRFIAASKLDEAGNATLALPKAGSFYVLWRVPDPLDRYCAYEGSRLVEVPGPANVTLETGKACA